MNGRLRSNRRARACSSWKTADVKGKYQFDRRLIVHMRMLVMNSCMSGVSCWLEMSWHWDCIQKLQASYSGRHLTGRYLRHSPLYC
jgi:hypothetical protein